MRLPAEKIKEAILNPDRELRDASVYYFARSYSPDPTIMPLVIQAFERFGSDAFERSSFLDGLVQSEESVAWLIREIGQIDPDADERSSDLFADLVDALRHADAAVLRPHADAIHRIEQLDDESKDVITDRIAISSFDPEALWRELTEFCDEEDLEEETSDEDFDFGCSVVDALASFSEHYEARVLEILNTGEAGNGWLEIMAVRLAGRLRMTEAIPYLVDLLGDPDLMAYEHARRALIQIGTDSVVNELQAQYDTDDDGLRLAIACLLEVIHTDLSVQTCLSLLEQEEDEEIRGLLIQSVLMNFSSEGIEPARQYVHLTPKNPEALEVRHDLLVASKMLGASFPEFDAWTEDSKTDTEFRRQWYKDHPLRRLAEAFEDEEEDIAWDDEEVDATFEEEVEDEFEDDPPDTVVRHDQRTGRNDPCPCGSGQKYKKCCIGKEVPQPEESHSVSIGRIRPGISAPQFPIATVALYGPDDKTTTKIVAAVIKHEGAEPVLERWVGSNIKDSPKVRRQIQEFIGRHRVKSVAATDRNMGCPHEEGPDFPVGEDCPFCPFWAGKQGSRMEEEP